MRRLLLSFTAASLLFGQVVSANAATFAQFQDGTTGSFLTNMPSGATGATWTGATLGTTGPTPYPIEFQFVSGAAPYMTGTSSGLAAPTMLVPAILTYTATTMPVLSNGQPGYAATSGPSAYTEYFNSVTLTVTATGAASSYGTLLTMTASAQGSGGNNIPAGALVGTTGTGSATFGGGDAPPISPNVVIFGSQYVNLAGINTKAYALSYSGVNPLIGVGGTAPFQLFINDFNAETTGTFSAQFQITPEPGTAALLAGFGATGGMLLRRRRR